MFWRSSAERDPGKRISDVQSSRGCQIISANTAIMASRSGRGEHAPDAEQPPIVRGQRRRIERRLTRAIADAQLDAKGAEPSTRRSRHKTPARPRSRIRRSGDSPIASASRKPLSGWIAIAAIIDHHLDTDDELRGQRDDRWIAGAMRQHHEGGKAEPRAEHRRRGEQMHEFDGENDVDHRWASLRSASETIQPPECFVASPPAMTNSRAADCRH